MKSEDLMVGDWVRNELGEIQQVVELREAGAMLAYNDIYPYESLDPIPLTPEILEKNGFDINGIPENMQPVEERDWSDDTYVWSRQETPYESTEVCVYMEDTDNFFAEIICQHCHVDGVHIKYVHELQHALRLCKIDKTIEL